jgi:hypothetical protein
MSPAKCDDEPVPKPLMWYKMGKDIVPHHGAFKDPPTKVDYLQRATNIVKMPEPHTKCAFKKVKKPNP